MVNMFISVTLCFFLIQMPVAITLRCYWCSGVGQQRECERTPSDVTTGPVFINCKTKYCVSTKVMDANTGEVKSFARLCANVPRGNTCVRDARLITCFETCTKDFCNDGDPDPSTLRIGSYSEEFLGLPLIEPLNFRNREVPRFPVPRQSKFITSSKFLIKRTSNNNSAKKLTKQNEKLKGVLSDGETWTLPDIHITTVGGNTKLFQRANNRPLPRKAMPKRWFNVYHLGEKGESLDYDEDGYYKRNITIPPSKHPLILSSHVNNIIIGISQNYSMPDKDGRSQNLKTIPFPIVGPQPSPFRDNNYTNARSNPRVFSEGHRQKPTFLQNNKRNLNESVEVNSDIEKQENLQRTTRSSNNSNNDTNINSGQSKIKSFSPQIHVVHFEEPYRAIKGLNRMKSPLFHFGHLNLTVEDQGNPVEGNDLYSLSKNNDTGSAKATHKLSNEMDIIKHTTECKLLAKKMNNSNRGKLEVSFLKILALTFISPDCSNVLRIITRMGDKISWPNFDRNSSEINSAQPNDNIDYRYIPILDRSKHKDIWIDIIRLSWSAFENETKNESARNAPETESGAKKQIENQYNANLKKVDGLPWNNDTKVPHMRRTSSIGHSSNKILVSERTLVGRKISRQTVRSNQFDPVARAWQKLALLESSNKIKSHRSTINGRHSGTDKKEDQLIDGSRNHSSNHEKEPLAFSLIKPIPIMTNERESTNSNNKSNENTISKRFHLKMALSMPGQHTSLGAVGYYTTSKPITYPDIHKGQSRYMYHQIPPKDSRKRYPTPRIFLTKSPLHLQPANLQAFDSCETKHISHWLLSLVVVILAFRIFAYLSW